MKEQKLLDRREFTLSAAMAVLAGVAITISGCGSGSGSGSGSPTAPTPSPSGGDKTASIAANHGHSATVTSAQLSAGGGITLGIQGSAAHNHTVTLEASDLSAISAGQRTSKESSNDPGHSHTVTFN